MGWKWRNIFPLPSLRILDHGNAPRYEACWIPLLPYPPLAERSHCLFERCHPLPPWGICHAVTAYDIEKYERSSNVNPPPVSYTRCGMLNLHLHAYSRSVTK